MNRKLFLLAVIIASNSASIYNVAIEPQLVQLEIEQAEDFEIIYQDEFWINTETHYPYFLVDKFPEALQKIGSGGCQNNDRVVGCWTGNAVYILNGTEGDRGADDTGGCNVFWHEVKHADGLNHSMMTTQYPNELCSATHYEKDAQFCINHKYQYPQCM